MNETILVVAAHPDDEILGVAGTAMKHRKNGDIVFALILGEGITSRDKFNEAEIKELHAQTHSAAQIIGFTNVFFSNLPDNKFDSLPLLNIIKIIEKYLEKLKPTKIYTHHKGDLNIDHQMTYNAVLTTCRPCNKNCPREILTFETLSSTEWQDSNDQFKPNFYSNIEYEIEDKISAMKAYYSEIRNFPHSRSAEGLITLAKMRGMEAGIRFAEAFCLIRKIDK